LRDLSSSEGRKKEGEGITGFGESTKESKKGKEIPDLGMEEREDRPR